MVRLLLGAVQLARQVEGGPVGTVEDNCWKRNWRLEGVNYLHCARAALDCGAECSAVVMTAVWCYEAGLGLTVSDWLGTASLLDRVTEDRPAEGQAAQDILYRAAVRLADRDAAAGAGRARLADSEARAEQLCLEGEWSAALPLLDGQVGVAGALAGAGLHHTLAGYLAATPELGAGLVAHQQDCRWRLQEWEQLRPAEASARPQGCVLGALEAAVRGDAAGAAAWRAAGARLVGAELASLAGPRESAAAVLPGLARLAQLGDIARLAGLAGDNTARLEEALTGLEARDKLAVPALLEPLLTSRLVLVANTSPGLLEPACLAASRLARTARLALLPAQLARLHPAPHSYAVRLEEAQVSFELGGAAGRDTALLLAKRLLRDLELAGTEQATHQVGVVLYHLNITLGTS